MNRIITISREFGSGGRELGRRLSEELNIAYYDREIISEISKRTELAEQYIEQIIGQKSLMSFPIHIGRSFYPVVNPVFEQRQGVILEQQKIIEDIAKKSDCIIVGRCAEYILRDYNPFRIFVYSDLDSKVERCREKASDKENMTDKKLRQQIISINKNRADYYKSCTGKQWGDKLNYDLCINTTQKVIKDIVPVFSKTFL